MLGKGNPFNQHWLPPYPKLMYGMRPDYAIGYYYCSVTTITEKCTGQHIIQRYHNSHHLLEFYKIYIQSQPKH